MLTSQLHFVVKSLTRSYLFLFRNTSRRRTPPHTHTYLYSIRYLWLGEHVQTPGADLAVSGDANEVVGVLGADHVDAVHRVLRRQRGRRGFLRFCRVGIKEGARRAGCTGVPCVPPPTGGSSAPGSSCCSCCPTAQSAPSTCPPPQRWGETWQKLPT